MAIFIAFTILSALFLINAIYDRKSRRPAGIYANIKPPKTWECSDIKSYNRAVSNLIFVYALLLFSDALSGLFLSNMQLAIYLIATVLPGVIAMMIIYELVIANKYIHK